MKTKSLKRIFCIALTTFGICQAESFAQSGRSNQDTVAQRYTKLAESQNPADKVKLEKELHALLKSNKESDWTTAAQYFYRLGKPKVQDSIVAAGKKKFPEGMWVRNGQVQDIYDEKDPVQKEKKYLAWIKRFAPERFGEDRIQYDYVSNAVAVAYAEAGNVSKAIAYANKIYTPAWKGEGYAGPAMRLLKTGHAKEAEELLKKAWDVAYKAATTNKSMPGAGFTAQGLPGYSRTLAELHIKRNDYHGAMQYLKPVVDNVPSARNSLSDQYSQVLQHAGQKSEALAVLQNAIKAGGASQEMQERFKKLWSEVKGSEAGYTEFMTIVRKELTLQMNEELQKKMINQTAPQFVLKDVDGKAVALNDLKGKVVVLDFWATWCGPCKASFPGMKLAVQKYANDKDVKFLFIHTWEKENNATEGAKQFVSTNNYPFQVLMDLKNDKGINAVVTDYKVQGIPAKFILDKNGNIRFQITGGGGKYDPVEEMTAMIEAARKAS